MKPEYPGYDHGMDFIAALCGGGWPTDLSGCWLNFIETDTSYTIALYFNDTYPEGTVVESSVPILDKFPTDYPDAYMSWGKQSREIYDTYVRPQLRGNGIASAIAMMVCIHTAQTSEKYISPKPNAYNEAVSNMITRAEQTYGVQHGVSAFHLFNAGVVFTAFEPIELQVADETL